LGIHKAAEDACHTAAVPENLREKSSEGEGLRPGNQDEPLLDKVVILGQDLGQTAIRAERQRRRQSVEAPPLPSEPNSSPSPGRRSQTWPCRREIPPPAWRALA